MGWSGDPAAVRSPCQRAGEERRGVSNDSDPPQHRYRGLRELRDGGGRGVAHGLWQGRQVVYDQRRTHQGVRRGKGHIHMPCLGLEIHTHKRRPAGCAYARPAAYRS